MGSTKKSLTPQKSGSSSVKAKSAEPVDVQEEVDRISFTPEDPKPRLWHRLKKKEKLFRRVLHLLLALIVGILALAVIILAITTALQIQKYTSNESDRVIALTVLVIASAISLAAVAYVAIAVIRLHRKALLITSIVFIICIVLQIAIAAIGLHLTESGEQRLSREMIESFRNSRSGLDAKALEQWGQVQSTDNEVLIKSAEPLDESVDNESGNQLSCCGFYGADDYRQSNINFFPPDVPISCCPKYDSSQPSDSQEGERLLCKSKKDYYPGGCRTRILDYFHSAASVILKVLIALIAGELILAIIGFIISIRARRNAQRSTGEDDDGQIQISSTVNAPVKA